MQTRLINLNCKEKEYKFNMSAISEQDMKNLAYNIVLIKGENVKNLTLNGYKVVIRDNKAKFKLFYQDSFYHELEYYLDEFGRANKNYQDIISELWQDLMRKYYGKEYDDALKAKLSFNEQQL